MSATTGRIERRTISFSASPPRLSGTATRAISHPAACSCSIWRIVASTSCVSVVHIDWTETGAPSPIAVPPTQTRFDLRRGRGPRRSSGRLRSTSIRALMTQVYVRNSSHSVVVSVSMRALALAVIACTLACTSAPTSSTIASATAPTTSNEPAASVDPADRACMERAMNSLIRAMNEADEARLKLLLGSASVGIGEQAAMYPDETVARLVARARDGERWTLIRLDVNGRGGAGGVNFGVRLQRSVSGRTIDSTGKGAVECPEEKFLIFFAT